MPDGPTEKKYRNVERAKAKAKPDSSTLRQLGEIISMHNGPTEKKFRNLETSNDINEKKQDLETGNLGLRGT